MADFGPWEHREGMDTWVDTPFVSENRVAPVCSFCGSLHPGKFLELAARGWRVEPTDKPYKAYLHEVHFGPMKTAVPGESLPPVSSKTAKFYYQHFTQEQKRNFISLYNEGTLALTAPGHFYVLPFFMRVDQ